MANRHHDGTLRRSTCQCASSVPRAHATLALEAVRTWTWPMRPRDQRLNSASPSAFRRASAASRRDVASSCARIFARMRSAAVIGGAATAAAAEAESGRAAAGAAAAAAAGSGQGPAGRTAPDDEVPSPAGFAAALPPMSTRPLAAPLPAGPAGPAFVSSRRERRCPRTGDRERERDRERSLRRLPSSRRESRSLRYVIDAVPAAGSRLSLLS